MASAVFFLATAAAALVLCLAAYLTKRHGDYAPIRALPLVFIWATALGGGCWVLTTAYIDGHFPGDDGRVPLALRTPGRGKCYRTVYWLQIFCGFAPWSCAHLLRLRRLYKESTARRAAPVHKLPLAVELAGALIVWLVFCAAGELYLGTASDAYLAKQRGRYGCGFPWLLFAVYALLHGGVFAFHAARATGACGAGAGLRDRFGEHRALAGAGACAYGVWALFLGAVASGAYAYDDADGGAAAGADGGGGARGWRAVRTLLVSACVLGGACAVGGARAWAALRGDTGYERAFLEGFRGVVPPSSSEVKEREREFSDIVMR